MTSPGIQLPRGTLMSWNGQDITDHNRSALDIGVERIESVQRMANGTMRKYIVADKFNFSVSWNDLPEKPEGTFDGKLAGAGIEGFYLSGLPFILEIHHKILSPDGVTPIVRDARYRAYNVVITDFSKTLTKRANNRLRSDFWDIDVTMEEL